MILMFSHLITFIIFTMANTAPNFYRLQLFGNKSIAYYYVKLNIGKPLQPQSILVDTGSYFTVIPCASCKTCKSQRLEQLFNTQRSFTITQMKCVDYCLIQNSRADVCKDRCKLNTEYCDYYVNYADGSSVIGRVMEDEISF